MPLRSFIACIALSLVPLSAMSQGNGLTGGASGYSLIPRIGTGALDNAELEAQLREFASKLCDEGQTPASDGCIRIGQGADLGTLFGLPAGCLEDPCAAGCPGQETMLCLPPLLKSQGAGGAVQKSGGDSETIAAQTIMPAQGGALAVTTYGDGSHEVHQFVSGQGFVLIESGGGGGGHTELLDQIRGQWALE